MRAGLSSIQQTLTPEASTVLNQSIAEARRRNHGQTTPLHVAATLLASPSGYLRTACIRSHPNSSHPLQCRALELCFSVALERLTTAQSQSSSPGLDPPISNALMAALKRAQAHQRRGCPEQQQQPLLAVKVELEQLIISILDDPSVSRVMREASFSSPAVKATIEQSLNTSVVGIQHHHVGGGFGGGRIGGNAMQLTSQLQTRMMNNNNSSTALLTTSPVLLNNNSNNKSSYLNPRLQNCSAGTGGVGSRNEEVKKVLEIMIRGKKKNPVLVGDSEPDGVVREFFRRIRGKDSEFDALKGVEIVEMDVGGLLDRSLVVVKIKELRGVIESKISGGCGVILDLGDLKWLVEQPVGFGGVQPQHGIGRAAVAEMANLVRRFARDGGEEDEGGNKVWLIGTATCETYLRCQVYHSTMENDWDLQAVPIASRSPLPGMFPRMLNNPVEPLTSLRTVQTPPPTLTRSLSEKSDSVQQSTFCPKCSENCEKELARLTAIEKTFSTTKQDENRPSLPQWLQNAKLSDPKTSDKSQEKDGVLSKQRTQELQKKWKDTCLNLHPNFHQKALPHAIRPPGPPALSIPGMYNPNLLSRPPFQPKLQTTKPLGNALQLNMNPITSPLTERVNTLDTSLLARQPVEQVNSPPGSPVGTDLVLGRKDTPEKPAEIQAKDFLSCISSEPQIKLFEKFANALDADTYKKLLKGLMEKAWWQAEAATALASAVTRCSLGNGKQRGGVLRGDVWLLFTGPDRIGKRKMVSVLADQICGAAPMMICLGSRRDGEDSETGFRGRTATDRIAEAVRRNSCSVIMLEDIDEADTLVRGSIKRAMERGRLTDTHGREVGLGNAVFILTGDWSTTSPEGLRDGHFVNERKLAEVASGNWQLGLIVREKNAKRRAHWLHNDEDRLSKSRKEMGSGLSLDLNLTVDNDDGRADGSYNSSDLTIDHEDELGLANRNFSIASVPHDLANNVDDSIVFKPVDSAFVRREIKKTISVKFAMVVDENLQIEVDDEVLEKIMGGLWHDKTSLGQWIENVLEPSFDQLKPLLPGGDRSRSVVRLVVESDGVNRGKTSFGNENWLPSTILV